MHVPRAFGLGHMHCKRPKADVLGSYIRGIHHVSMIHVIYTLIAWYKDTIFYQVVYMQYIYWRCQHRAMAAISVYVMLCYVVHEIMLS